MNEQALCIVEFSKIFGNGEFFGDITNDSSVIQSGNNTCLQRLGNIWPGYINKYIN